MLKKSFIIHLCCLKNIVLEKLTISRNAINLLDNYCKNLILKRFHLYVHKEKCNEKILRYSCKSSLMICVCVYVCVYICVCVFVCMYICVCMYIYIYVFVYLCVCIYVYVCVYVHICLCIYIYVYIYITW